MGEHGRGIERVGTLVIGGGQAGLAVGYHLRQRDLPFLIVDAGDRIGDAWRQRWDSLRLFTPARFDGLPGRPFPAPPHAFPTKDEMADYLEDYAAHFALPVRTGTRVERLTREGDRFVATLGVQLGEDRGEDRLEADTVVVAMGTYQRPRLPPFAAELAPGIVQLHSKDYRHPGQLQPGDVLLVGAGNSASELAMELSGEHRVVMAGRDTGAIPFRIDGWFARTFGVRFVLRVLFRRVLTVWTPVGRRARPKVLTVGGPLVRVKPRDLRAAGVERTPRVTGVRAGWPVLEDGRVLDVANVIWCTGFHPGFDWIDLPIHDEHEPRHEAGVCPVQPGLYFVGLHFLSAMSSEMIHGVGDDAERIVAHLAERIAAGTGADVPAAVGSGDGTGRRSVRVAS
jgi:putative flavoprotein involved in K+ transport